MRRPRKLVKSEPNTAAPKELPIVRKKVTPDVATPRSAKSVVFCTIRTSTCMHIPMPVPRTNRYSDCISVGVDESMRDSSTKPTHMIAVPRTGKIL